VSHHGEHVIIDLLLDRQKDAAQNEVATKVNWIVSQLKVSTSLDTFISDAVHQLRSITSFDRVMAYKFNLDHSGEVVAEEKEKHLESFFGLRFPAFDIPPSARDLFKKLPVRVINDVNAQDSPLVFANELPVDVDLTLSVLRGTAPVHMQYLKNMGVTSSMTVPIVLEGKLWGLFAHHHYSGPKNLLADEIAAVELVSKVVNLAFQSSWKLSAEKETSAYVTNAQNLVYAKTNELGLDEFWRVSADEVKKIHRCEGVTYIIEDRVLKSGSTPSSQDILTVADHISSQAQNIFFTDQCKKDFDLKQAGDSAGFLCVTLRLRNPRVQIIFFRDEINKTVNWAGNPEKDIVFEENATRLHPRSSFKSYKEETKGVSDAWTPEEIRKTEVIAKALTAALNLELGRLYKTQTESEKLRVVVKELNHRIKNLLTLVRSISKNSAKSSSSIDEFSDAVERRIMSLSLANDLISQNEYGRLSLKNLISTALAPFTVGKNVVVDGPDVELETEASSIFALVIHELATNAVKYGGLSDLGHSLRVVWSLDEKSLKFNWEEKLKEDTLDQPSKEGFGMKIIKNALDYEFEGSTSIEFLKSGLCVSISLPKENCKLSEKIAVTSDALIEGSKLLPEPLPSSESEKASCLFLILEDNFLVTQDMIELAKSFSKLDPISVGSPNEALIQLKNEPIDFCLLDVNLRNETSAEVARHCAAQNIPFFYTTGYGSGFEKLDDFPRAPVLYKPVDQTQFTESINKVLEQRDAH